MRIVNVTNHNIDMLFCSKLRKGECEGRKEGNNYLRECRNCPYENGGVVDIIEPSGIAIQATPKDEFYKEEDGTVYITTHFEPKKESEKELEKMERKYDDAIFVGSIIAAQAFPERVVAMVPVPGYERVPMDKKLVRSDKFTIFPKE